jgi:pimeloyl-ACP methyl ester carboxylesterase
MTQAGGWPLLGTLSLWLAAQPVVLRTMLAAAFHAPETHLTAEVLARGRAALAGGENRRALLALSRNYNATDMRRTGLRARLGELRCRSLIVWGEQDRVFDQHYGVIARREIPGAQLVVIPRCGHFPQIEAFRAFHGLLLGFLAGSA